MNDLSLASRMLAGILFMVGGLAVARPSVAYQKHEHEGMSTLALAVALEALGGELGDGFEEDIRVRFLQCPDARERKLACENGVSRCVPFGLLTRAVDKVLRPEGLIPSRHLHLDGFPSNKTKPPERCDEPESPTTATVKQKLEETSDPAKLFGFACCRAERKSRNVWTWFMAVHRNASHFEACAAAKYNALHQLAVELAEASRTDEGAEPPFVALVTEAVALHFLQDSFAPGHLLTPRSGSTDILARGMHNLHNRLGAPVLVKAAEPWADLEDALRRVLQDGQRLPAVTDALRELSLDLDSMRASRPQCNQRYSREPSSSTGPCYFGDGQLKDTRQAVDLILLSAASIREVLSAGAPGGPLQIDFREWSALPKEDDQTLEEETLWRPWLIVAPSGAESLSGPEPTPAALAGFEKQKAQGLDRFAMRPRNFEVAVAYVFGDSDQDPGWRGEIGLPFGSPSDGDVRRRDKEGALVPCDGSQGPCYFGRQPGRALLGLPMTWTLQGEEWDDYEALGLTLRPWLVGGRHGKLGWDVMWSLEAGWKWYFSEVRDTDRFVWGSHLALGLGIAFLDFGFERGSRLLESGEHKRNSSYSVGLRFHVP